MDNLSDLREREEKILDFIVASYVRDGRPVSSNTIASSGCVGGSPATIRNVMVRLEFMGFLSQPHTSAGRVPTDHGIRHYVNSILPTEEITPERETAPLFQENMPACRWDFGSLLSQASRVLADSSDNLGFVISPHISRINFQAIRLVKISDERILIIVVTPFNMVLTESIETELRLNQQDLDRTARFINENFRGKTLAGIKAILLKEFPRYRAKFENMTDKVMDIIRASVAYDDGDNRIYLQGTVSLLEKADRFDWNRLRQLFRSIEEKARLVRLLSDLISLERVKVLIGSEVEIPDIQDCSLILSHYGYGNQVLGSLGIIGPKRLPYDRMIPLVDRVARRLSHAITVCSKEVSI